MREMKLFFAHQVKIYQSGSDGNRTCDLHVLLLEPSDNQTREADNTKPAELRAITSEDEQGNISAKRN